MISNIKALIVILAIATAVFHVFKPTALRFGDAADFARRRNVWYALTIVGMLSPSFWLYSAIAVPVMLWAGNKDPNPIALYLLLCFVVPPVSVDVPILFSFENLRLLALFVLVPAALRFRRFPKLRNQGSWTLVSACVVGFWLLQTLIFVPPDVPGHVIFQDSFTNLLRRGLEFCIDCYVLFWVSFRTLAKRRSIEEALSVYCLNCCLLAALAFFETVRHWYLYTNINSVWAGANTEYAMRGDALRAIVSSGGPLSLGYMLAIAFGCWQYFKATEPSRVRKIGIDILLWLGLLGAYSRGPWIGAVVIYILYLAMSPGAVRRLAKAFAIGGALFAGLLLLPIGSRILKGLPMFGGQVNADTIDYRSRLLHRSLEVIMDNPFFGDQLSFLRMEDLRQGQGIIDLTNTYVQMALDYGLVGLFLFSGILVFGILKTYRLARSLLRSDTPDGMLGVCLVACALGTVFMLADNSFMLAYAKLYFVLAGIMGAYVNLPRSVAHLAKQHSRVANRTIDRRPIENSGKNSV